MKRGSDLRQRARRNGTRSKYAGDEPRNDEAIAHWPKPKRKALPKRTAAWRRKAKMIRHADEAAYRARLTAPWPIYARAKKGGDDQ